MVPLVFVFGLKDYNHIWPLYLVEEFVLHNIRTKLVLTMELCFPWGFKTTKRLRINGYMETSFVWHSRLNVPRVLLFFRKIYSVWYAKNLFGYDVVGPLCKTIFLGTKTPLFVICQKFDKWSNIFPKRHF